MTKEKMIEVMLEVARRRAMETTATHPVDLATAMSFAIETAGETLDVLG